MKIEGNVSFGDQTLYVQAETAGEFLELVQKLTEGAPAHFERVAQIKQAAIAAEVLSKPEASKPVERTKSTPPPNANKKADKDGCRHGPWTVFEEGKYQHTHYCSGQKDDKCSFKELQAAGIR